MHSVLIGALCPIVCYAVRRHDNRIFNPFGDAKVSCADLSPPWTSHIYTFAEWAALGYDKGTTVGKTPPVDEIIGMAKAILRM